MALDVKKSKRRPLEDAINPFYEAQGARPLPTNAREGREYLGGAPQPVPPGMPTNPSEGRDYLNRPPNQGSTAPTPGPTSGVPSPIQSAPAPAATPNIPNIWDQNWFRTNIGAPNTPSELLALEQKINQMGGRVHRNASGVAGKVYDPSGALWDIINGAARGGLGFQWLDAHAGGPPGGGEFSDPWGSSFEQAIAERLAELRGEPVTDSLAAYLDRLLDADKNKQANTDQFVKSMRGRIGELQEPAYTSGDEALIRAKSFDQLERRRQETLKNRRNELYARGHAPTSGTVIGAENDTNEPFEQARTGIESDLALDALRENQRRKDQALSLEGLIEQALSGADTAGLGMMAQAAEIENAQFQDKEARAREILATYLMPLDLMSHRQQLANQTLGNGGSPQSVMASIMGILSAGQQNRGLNLQSNANNMQGLGQLLQILNFGQQ